MSIPGFTAEHSLTPSSVDYHYPSSSTDAGVSLEVLDFVKEAFESVIGPVADALKDALSAAASGLKNAFNNVNSGGGQARQYFSCNNVIVGMFGCNGATPALSIAQMTQSCMRQAAETDNPLAVAACPAIAAAFYPLLTQYCKSPEGMSQADLINQACAGT
jgi:hypothetical protein